MTFNVVDSETGADFNFDIVAEAIRSDGGAATFRTAGNILRVDSAGNQDDRNNTEVLTSGGWSESIRLSIDNIVINAGPEIESFGFETLTMNALGSGDTGDIIDAATGDLLGSFDFDADGISRQAVDAGMGSSVIIEPTGGNGFGLMGFQASFQFPSATAVPEPQAVAIWAMLGLSVVGFGVYRGRRNK